MIRGPLRAVVLLLSVTAFSAGAGAGSDDSSAASTSASSSGVPTLVGYVGPRKEIGFYRKPTKPGTYRFVVQDNTIVHGFYLVGPGVNKRLSTVDGMRTFVTSAVTLKKGRYRYFCDLHTDLKGSFVIP